MYTTFNCQATGTMIVAPVVVTIADCTLVLSILPPSNSESVLIVRTMASIKYNFRHLMICVFLDCHSISGPSDCRGWALVGAVESELRGGNVRWCMELREL